MVEYSEGVLIGDWNERLQIKQGVLNTYIEKKKNNQLLTQKTALVKRNLLQEVSISVQSDGSVHYGDTVQIINPKFQAALSNVISHLDVQETQDLNEKCYLSGSSDLAPNVRNVFRVVQVNLDDQQRKPLRYGEEFYLMTIQTNREPFYVQSEIPNMTSSIGLSTHPRITLTKTRNAHCRWSILSHNKYEREDMLDEIVKTNVPVRINHCASNQQLALESKYQLFTIFGVEHEVSVHTYMNIHKREKIENSWRFSAPVP